MDKQTRRYLCRYVLEIATITAILFFLGYLIALLIIFGLDKWQIPIAGHDRLVLFSTLTGTLVFLAASVILWIIRAGKKQEKRK